MNRAASGCVLSWSAAKKSPDGINPPRHATEGARRGRVRQPWRPAQCLRSCERLPRAPNSPLSPCEGKIGMAGQRTSRDAVDRPGLTTVIILLRPANRLLLATHDVRLVALREFPAAWFRSPTINLNLVAARNSLDRCRPSCLCALVVISVTLPVHDSHRESDRSKKLNHKRHEGRKNGGRWRTGQLRHHSSDLCDSGFPSSSFGCKVPAQRSGGIRGSSRPPRVTAS